MSICGYCHEEVEQEGDLIVCTKSGDDGGTYDFCEVAPDETHAVAYCEWFALCDNEADGTVAHPILGDVPTCNRCATKHDLNINREESNT